MKSLGGVRNVLLERGEKPEKRGVAVEMGGATFLLLYSSITFTVCGGRGGAGGGGSKVPFIAFQIFSILS